MRTGCAFLIVYSVTDRKSFDEIPKFHAQVLRVKDRDNYPMLLVANKVDLIHQRKVTEEQGREMADKLKIPYIETSAKDPPLNVEAAFHQIVRIARTAPADEEGTPKRRRKKRRSDKKCTLM